MMSIFATGSYAGGKFSFWADSKHEFAPIFFFSQYYEVKSGRHYFYFCQRRFTLIALVF